jgi:hypothetical protein
MEHDEILKETYRLTQENNRMLRSMRRNAFWGGVIRLIIYAALLLVPVWFYFTYLAPVVEQMMQTVEQIQGTGAGTVLELQGTIGQGAEHVRRCTVRRLRIIVQPGILVRVAEVAQLVEHSPEERRVTSSILVLGTTRVPA